jgi:uncharacterized peroxidase-related enzyme
MHAQFVRCEGGRPELAGALKAGNWRAAPELTDRERALCTVAEKLSAHPTHMTAADWQPLRDLGFTDQGCLEVAHLVGLFNYLTRLADGFGLQPTESASLT